MIKMYFLCCDYRTRIKDQGIIKLRIAGLDKQINHSTRICIPIADWDSKKVQVKPTIPDTTYFPISLNNTLSA